MQSTLNFIFSYPASRSLVFTSGNGLSTGFAANGNVALFPQRVVWEFVFLHIVVDLLGGSAGNGIGLDETGWSPLDVGGLGPRGSLGPPYARNPAAHIFNGPLHWFHLVNGAALVRIGLIKMAMFLHKSVVANQRLIDL